jgi:hypothetical protein
MRTHLVRPSSPTIPQARIASYSLKTILATIRIFSPFCAHPYIGASGESAFCTTTPT